MMNRHKNVVSLSDWWHAWRQPVISVFLFAYVLLGSLWLCPSTLWRAALLKPLAPLISFIGMTQCYTLFAPMRKTNLFLQAQILFDDGSKALWAAKRPENSNEIERVCNERFRKYINDNMSVNSDEAVYNDFARYIARQSKSTGKEPRRIDLFVYKAPIPAPEGSTIPAPNEQFQVNRRFSYTVRNEDLL